MVQLSRKWMTLRQGLGCSPHPQLEEALACGHCCELSSMKKRLIVGKPHSDP